MPNVMPYRLVTLGGRFTRRRRRLPRPLRPAAARDRGDREQRLPIVLLLSFKDSGRAGLAAATAAALSNAQRASFRASVSKISTFA